MIGRLSGLNAQQMVVLAVLSVAAAALLSLGIALSRPAPMSPEHISITVPVPPPNLLRLISPEEALRQNANRSFAIRTDSAAAPFKFEGDSATEARAIQCLAQAAYYEAAADGPDGERAVAQVVLNRVRHPGFPPSICGVVYQGSDAPGCQFTFTCNGALAKVPSPALWIQAKQIAFEELSGRVFAPVGHATHYHADYVLPYWADSLDKSAQIGHQIFYRLKGLFGDAGAFSQSYARSEPPPPSIPTAIPPQTAHPNAGEAPPAQVSPGTASQSSPSPAHRQLAADISAGELIADDRAPPPTSQPISKSSRDSANCDEKGRPSRLEPLAADDLRTTTSAPCGR